MKKIAVAFTIAMIGINIQTCFAACPGGQCAAAQTERQQPASNCASGQCGMQPQQQPSCQSGQCAQSNYGNQQSSCASGQCNNGYEQSSCASGQCNNGNCYRENCCPYCGGNNHSRAPDGFQVQPEYDFTWARRNLKREDNYYNNRSSRRYNR